MYSYISSNRVIDTCGRAELSGVTLNLSPAKDSVPYMLGKIKGGSIHLLRIGESFLLPMKKKYSYRPEVTDIFLVTCRPKKCQSLL